MNSFERLGQSFLDSLDTLWERIFDYAPTFFGALIVLVLGILISNLLGKLANKLVSLLKLEKLTEKKELKDEFDDLGIQWNFPAWAEWLVKWFFYIVTFATVVDILNIEQLSSFLEKFVLYLPQVFVALIILAVGLVVGTLLKTLIEKASKGLFPTERPSRFLGNLAKWALFTFTLMAALVQLGVAGELVQILFAGFVLMLAVAGGLAFGLGGKEHASRILDRVEGELGAGKAVKTKGREKNT